MNQNWKNEKLARWLNLLPVIMNHDRIWVPCPVRFVWRPVVVLFRSLVTPLHEYCIESAILAVSISSTILNYSWSISQTVNIEPAEEETSTERFCMQSSATAIGLKPLIFRQIKQSLVLAYKTTFQLFPLGYDLFEPFTSVAAVNFVAGELCNPTVAWWTHGGLVTRKDHDYEVNTVSCSTPILLCLIRFFQDHIPSIEISIFIYCSYQQFESGRCRKIKIWQLNEGRVEPMLKSLFSKIVTSKWIKIALIRTLRLFSLINSQCDFRVEELAMCASNT